MTDSTTLRELLEAELAAVNQAPISAQQQMVLNHAILTPEQALAEFGNAGARRMYFPRDVRVALEDRRMVHWPAGFHTVPAVLAGHPYLAANRVRELPEGSEEAITAAKEVLNEAGPAVGYRMQAVRI